MLNTEISLIWELLTVVCACLVTQLCPALCDPFLCQWDFPGRYCSELPFPPPGNPPDPGIEPASPVTPPLQVEIFTC